MQETGWKRTTSPSGRHLGHYHALFRAFSYIDDDKKNKIEKIRDIIIYIHHLMLKVAMENKFVYEQWIITATQMIKKVPVCPKISRLKLIYLYECHINLIFRICF